VHTHCAHITPYTFLQPADELAAISVLDRSLADRESQYSHQLNETWSSPERIRIFVRERDSMAGFIRGEAKGIDRAVRIQSIMDVRDLPAFLPENP